MYINHHFWRELSWHKNNNNNNDNNNEDKKKKDKYLDFARESKKLRNIKVTIIPIVIGAFGTVTKGLLKGLKDLEVGGRMETIQTTALLRMLLRRVQGICCHSNSGERLSAKTDLKNSQGVNNNNNNNNNNNVVDYIEKPEGGLITAIRNGTDYTMDNRMTITWKQKWEEKKLYERFKRLINNISHEKIWTWLRKGNFKSETESLPIAAENNTKRTNHIEARIDKTQQNGKCRLLVTETKRSIT